MSDGSGSPIYYPPPRFNFQVIFSGGGITGEASFQEVSGIAQELGEETLAEGGVLDRVHRVPLGVTQAGDLTLKRGLVLSSSVRTWINDAITSFAFTPIQVQVSLLNPSQTPLLTWKFNNVWPKRWELDSLQSMENAVAVETLVLAYSWMTPA